MSLASQPARRGLFTLGEIKGRVDAVAYTLRERVVRLISARKANERGQEQYHETLSA
jgi:uncharacterized DUF497 family protein